MTSSKVAMKFEVGQAVAHSIPSGDQERMRGGAGPVGDPRWTCAVTEFVFIVVSETIGHGMIFEVMHALGQ